MTLIILFPVAFLLVSELYASGRRSARSRWHWVMYSAVVLGAFVDLLTLLPRDQPDGDPIAIARHAIVVANQNVVLSCVAAFFGVLAFGIFLLKLRRIAR